MARTRARRRRISRYSAIAALKFLYFVGKLVAAERRQALQTHCHNGFRLVFGQSNCTFGRQTLWRGSATPTSGATSFAGQLRAISSAFRSGAVRCGANDCDHFVDIGNRNGQTDQDVRPVTRLT